MPLTAQIRNAFIESYSVLKSAAAKIVGEADSEDVVQDAFVTLCQSDTEFRGESKIGTYLYRIVQNQALQMTRSESRGIRGKTIKPGMFAGDGKRGPDRSEGWVDSVHDLAYQKASEKSSDEMMLPLYTEPLTVADRDLMELRKIGKKWYLKAPEILGISPGAARVRFTRLSDKLRKSQAV